MDLLLAPAPGYFAPTMTNAEKQVTTRHFVRLQQLAKDGVVILAGPTFGQVNTRIVVFHTGAEH